MRAVCLLALRRPEEAVQDCRAALTLGPASNMCMQKLGQLCGLGDLSLRGAAAAYDNALTLDATDVSVERGRAQSPAVTGANGCSPS